ncbi:MAG: hypothetical protein ACTHN4_04815 [Sphingomicrobium sp.]
MTAPTLSEVVSNPEWLPHTFDAAGANLTFVDVPEAARRELMFLSDEHFAGNYPKATFPGAAVAAAAAQAPSGPLHCIFHTSFCCSTLFARAVDVPGRSSLLKEPDVLINLANRFIRSDDQANRQRLELVLRLLERPFAPGETVIVKPTNFANRLVENILAQRPQSKAVLLYSDVSTFLRSLLKRGMFGRIFGRKLFAKLRSWSPLDFGYGPDELIQLTDVQVTALAWLMQIHHFDAMARAFRDRVMVIDSATLLADPAAAVDEAQALFGLALDRSQVEAIASGPVFSKHSKYLDRDYDSRARDEEHRAATEAHSEELEMVVKWIEAVAAQIGAPLKPGL